MMAAKLERRKDLAGQGVTPTISEIAREEQDPEGDGGQGAKPT